MIDLTLIWNITLTLSTLSLLMFALLVARRTWDELMARNLAARRRAIRHKIFLLLDIDRALFIRRCMSPGYFTAKERRLVHEECVALCQIIKGRDQERIVELMRRRHFYRDDLLDLKRGSAEFRHAAVLGLQYFNHARAIKALLKALDDASDEVVLAAAHSLHALRQLPDLDVLLEKLAGRKLLQAAACRTLFHKIAVESPGQLVAAEKRFPRHAGVRALLAEGLGFSSSYSVLPCLQRLAADPAEAVRIEAIHAFMQLEHPSASSTILQALDDPQWEVRSAAVVAAGELGLGEALPKLELLLDAENWILRFNTALSLYQLGVAGRRVLLRRTRRADAAGRTANLVLTEKGVSSMLPTW